MILFMCRLNLKFALSDFSKINCDGTNTQSMLFETSDAVFQNDKNKGEDSIKSIRFKSVNFVAALPQSIESGSVARLVAFSNGLKRY